MHRRWSSVVGVVFIVVGLVVVSGVVLIVVVVGRVVVVLIVVRVIDVDRRIIVVYVLVGNVGVAFMQSCLSPPAVGRQEVWVL